jgi:uncharacterized protein YjbJ (UPF0337 family)
MSNDQEKDLGTQGQEDVMKGKMKGTAGKVQSKFGEVTGNKEAQAKGAAKQVEGTAQETKGKAERKVDDTIDRSKAAERSRTDEEIY